MASTSGTGATAPAPSLLGERYEVGELLRSSGMLDVFAGVDTLLERPVEIKQLRPEYARERGIRLRFRKEAQAASRLSSPNIVRVYDTGEASDARGEPVPYIVSEAAEGTPLNALIASGSITPAHAVSYASGMLEALEYAHRAGIVHRDVAPENVVITDDGGVRLANFGIARAVADQTATVSDVTRALGSADYLSPEQAKGDSIDARSDLYGVGVVLYEMLTGQPPFAGSTPVSVAFQHMSEAPKPPSAASASVPASLDRVSLRALAKDPERRFADAADFRAELRNAATGSAPSRHELESLASDLYGPSARNAAETARSLRQLSTDTTMSRTQAGPPVAWVWAAVMVLTAVLASILFWAAGVEPKEDAIDSVTMPTVTGLTYAEAKAALEAEGLVIDRIEESSPDVAEGSVTRTRPLSGTTLARGREVDVWVSSGPSNVAAPELLGLSQATATSALGQAGLKVGRIDSRVDVSVAPLTVLSASVQGVELEPGTELFQGTRVDLVIAADRVALPDMSGWAVDRAETRATELGLTAVVREDAECAGDDSTVGWVSHSPGDIPVGTEITLYTCSG